MPIIIVETGYNQETVEKLMRRFIDYGKIIYSSKTREIGIVNWPKYNSLESPKTKACVIKELKEIKDRSLIDQIYPIQGVSQKEQEEENEKEKTAAEEKGTPSIPAAGIIIPENGKDEYDYNCHSIIDQSIMIFDRIWNQPNKNPEEYRLVSEYIIAYGFKEVEFAFREAVKYISRKLAYVEAICKKRKEKLAIEKSKEEARQKKLEQDKLLPSQREARKKLNLVEMTFGKNP